MRSLEIVEIAYRYTIPRLSDTTRARMVHSPSHYQFHFTRFCLTRRTIWSRDTPQVSPLYVRTERLLYYPHPPSHSSQRWSLLALQHLSWLTWEQCKLKRQFAWQHMGAWRPGTSPVLQSSNSSSLSFQAVGRISFRARASPTDISRSY